MIDRSFIEEKAERRTSRQDSLYNLSKYSGLQVGSGLGRGGGRLRRLPLSLLFCAGLLTLHLIGSGPTMVRAEDEDSGSNYDT